MISVKKYYVNELRLKKRKEMRNVIWGNCVYIESRRERTESKDNVIN